MDSSGASSLDTLESVEKQALKLRRSCEICRAAKGKCVPSKEDRSKCQKCVKERKACVFLEAKPRPKRAKNSRTRVAEMEERLEGLYALLSSSTKAAKEKEAISAPPQPLTPAQIEAPPSNLNELFSMYMAPPPVWTEASKFPQQYPIWSFPHLIFDDIQDVISKGILTFQEAQLSLNMFRTKAHNFPFVLVPPQTSLDSMRREKPFLLLTVLAYGAQETFKLQKTLELEIREQIARKVVVNGEKSIDLLQGMLVYLCWYQFYFKPERQQVYQLSQMIAAMAVDLGLDRPALIPSQQNNFIVPLSPTPFVDVASQGLNLNKSPEELEAKRTYLGSYYLSSAVALGLRKPNTLKYGAYTEECSQILAQVGDAETDYLLSPFTRLQKFAEEINHAFDYNAALQHPQLDSTRVEILSQTFSQQLDQLQMTVPPNAWSNVQLSLSYHFLRIYINEVGFHASPPSPLELMSGQMSLRSWYFSKARNESLINCLQAAQSYLDYVIEVTPRQAVDFTLPDYLRIVYAILILGRFTTGCDCPILDASSIRKTANLSFYLDKLIDKYDDVIMLSNDRDVNDTFLHMQSLWKKSKQWHDEIVRDPVRGRDHELCQPELNFMDILPSAFGKCVDFSGTTSCDEKWSDFLCFEDSSIISMNGGLDC